MSGHENVRAYISSELQRLGRLDKLAEKMLSIRQGNGWYPSKIAEVVMKVVHQPLDKLARKAIRPGVSRGIADMFRPARETSRITGPATLVYVPLWYVKGYYECYYLREAIYKVPVDKDVVAVEVDGETRDLMMEEQESKIVPEAFKRRLKRFSGLFTGLRRYFNLSDALELAVKYARAEMYVTLDGHEGEMLEEVLPRSWRTQRIFDITQLHVEGTATKIATSEETKERVVERFQERLVRMPEPCKQALSNTFQVEALTQYYVPYVHFPVTRGGRIDHVIVNGASADIPDEKMIRSVKRQLSL